MSDTKVEILTMLDGSGGNPVFSKFSIEKYWISTLFSIFKGGRTTVSADHQSGRSGRNVGELKGGGAEIFQWKKVEEIVFNTQKVLQSRFELNPSQILIGQTHYIH